MAQDQPRTFTRDEAEQLLPEIERLLAEAQRLMDELGDADTAADQDQWKARTNGHVNAAKNDTAQRRREAIAERLTSIVGQIQQHGVIVRDIRSGLIDFPSFRDGRVINLCWRRGEPLQIRWWHDLESGFSGRQPLDD